MSDDIGYTGNKESAKANPDVSRYPRHVPTVREQLAESKAKLNPDGLTKRDVANFTAIGVLSNPMTLRSHLEDEYAHRSAAKRTEEAKLTDFGVLVRDGAGDRVTEMLEEVGFVTPAFVKGPDAGDTAYPSKSRR